MNKIRRKALQEIYDKLSDLREELETIKDEEDESRENMPETCKAPNVTNSRKPLPATLMKQWNI